MEINGGLDPPRGFAFAWFKINGADVGVYCVHLKSNLIRRGDKKAEAMKNVRKREVAAGQLLAHLHDMIATALPAVKGVIVGGDFNTNKDQELFAKEDSLTKLPKPTPRSGRRTTYRNLNVDRMVEKPFDVQKLRELVDTLARAA